MSAQILDNGKALRYTYNGQEQNFHAIWLRDNAWDGETRSVANAQRLVTINSFPEAIIIDEAEVKGDELYVCFAPENKTIRYDLHWLERHCYGSTPEPKNRGWLSGDIEPWDSALQDNVPCADFTDLRDQPEVLSHWLDVFVKYGFGKIINGPIEDRALMQVVDLFGYVRETNYGKHFEVRTEVNPSNLAFTGLGLQAHTDNPYRDPVPTIQVLYCLESSAAGGDNMVVDGFAVAKRLQSENPDYFALLAKYCARFEYTGEDGVHLSSRRPMIELSADGELIQIRFNNRSMAAITDVPYNDMADYYAAYRRFAEIVDDQAMEVTFRLEPGESFVVDNTRVLHARKGYSGSGKRWLQGCYADKDGLHSRQRVLAAKYQGGV